ncbi:hypothetical protein N7541_006603 [Penicillium brevicompactum]|uniref:Major facilitator superfamily (MFS) profile domain-containing protein n=1 Tax=Penicillium brevicompactum TaxID=5074 RepID=A0A9W9URN6_PENBR|nr:hypothetical protein N7541_006603 [Penicillium brevicompactum]
MITLSESRNLAPRPSWGYRWRSSDTFILSSMSMALFTDEMLFAFMVPLLPHIFENRLGLDATLTQRYTSVFLVEGALISIVLLLALLVLTLIMTWLFIGRFFQCIVSNALYIVGIATMAENIGSEHMGKIAGLSSTLTSAGTCSGPVIAGFLFEIGCYWVAWIGAALFLVVDIIMRLLIIEKPLRKPTDQTNSRSLCAEGRDRSEREPLLNGTPSSPLELDGWRFYVYIFRQPRFTAGILCYFVFALFIASFESTLAMHVRHTFDWGVFQVGLLFASIQGPGLILSPFVGWLKDRVGSRVPTTIGFFSLAPFLWLLGMAGDERFPWAAFGNRGKMIYATCTTTVGCLMCLLNGTVDELEEQSPGIFGSHGGYSRAVAMTNMTWMSGLLVGPILAGLMVERLGYFELQSVLAVTSMLASIIAAMHLSSAHPKSDGCPTEVNNDS